MACCKKASRRESSDYFRKLIILERLRSKIKKGDKLIAIKESSTLDLLTIGETYIAETYSGSYRGKKAYKFRRDNSKLYIKVKTLDGKLKKGIYSLSNFQKKDKN